MRLICPICHMLSYGGWTHPQCKTKYGLDRLISYYEYDGWAKKIIKNVKFKKNKIYRALTDLSSDFACELKGLSSPGEVNPYEVPVTMSLREPPSAARGNLTINDSPARNASHSEAGGRLMDNGEPVLVPVPLHWYRQFKRGLNQSSIIARSLGRGLNLPVNEKILKRIRHTEPQTLIDRASRLKNIRGAFSIGPGFFGEKSAGTLEPLPKRSTSRERIVPKRRVLSWVGHANFPKDCLFILVDDVWTTGVTLSECCRVLKRAGAKQVWAVTLLRA